MCIDYISLNKAYPKDEYPLPLICQVVNFMSLCELLSFLDAYLGYHQINLVIDSEEKTMFIRSFEIFCYTKMTFGLKNGGGGHVSEVRTHHPGSSNWEKRRSLH
jgi:hypothetical protein